MGYYKDLEIDQYNLLKEWREQPKLYLEYAEEASQAQEEVNRLKDELEVLESQVNLEIRSNEYERMPEKAKVTEGLITSLLRTDPRVIALRQEYNEALYNADVLKKSEKAFYMRKEALENIVKLTGREYYAEPNDTSDHISNEKENVTKTAIDAKLNRR